MNAAIPLKILNGRVVMVVVSPDPVYQNMDIAESMDSEEAFKSMMTSSENQIGFASSLTKHFLRTADGPSVFHSYLKDSAQAVASFLPHYSFLFWALCAYVQKGMSQFRLPHSRA